MGDVVHVGNFIDRINENGDACGNVGAQFRQAHHSDRPQNGPVHVGARVDHGDFCLRDAAENLDEFPLGFLSGFNKIHSAGIGRAQGAVEGVEVAAFPGNASLAHPFAARNGLGGLAKVAACLDGHDDFEALRVNLRPDTGERLTPRTKDTRQPTIAEAAQAFREKEARFGTAQEIANFRLTMKPVSNRVAFFDFQCSAQKSVSILAVLGGDRRLRIAHERAARIALSELERFASRQKNTPLKRQSEATGNICAAAFIHDASRALDPQLHTHFVIANATRDRTGKWYALNEYEMVRAVRYAGKVYQNEMARGVQELGYAVRQTRQNGEITGFEIEGVSDSLCERFSKRREEIERQIEKFEEKQGRKPTVKEIALITRETRPAELREIATAEVLALQRSQLSPKEWTQLQALRARSERQTVPIQTGQERDALRASVAHLFERQSVLREHEILAEALNQSLGSLDLEELKQAASNDEAGLVRLASPAENPLLSECCTRQGLELEQWAVKYVDATKGSCPALNSRFVPAGHLSEEQKQAVASILGTRDRVYSFRGVAGAGKTTALREVQRGLNEAGHTVFAITPTASAAQVLRNEGFTQATTVEDFLRNGENRVGLRRAVVICDEAGLKSNRQGAELLRLAQTHDLRVLLVGDVRQHVSVEAGDFLRVLEAHSQLGRCQVGEIQGRFRLNTDWLSRKWLLEMSAAGWRNWIISTVLGKANRVTWNTRGGLFTAHRSGAEVGSLLGRVLRLRPRNFLRLLFRSHATKRRAGFCPFPRKRATALVPQSAAPAGARFPSRRRFFSISRERQRSSSLRTDSFALEAAYR